MTFSPGIKCLIVVGSILGTHSWLECRAQIGPPQPFGPVPTEHQLRWQKMEFYGFVHLSLNTYTDKSWGYGDEPVDLFNPEALDCRRWARVCKEVGMTGIILTAKHHGGFCLWPSQYTEYSVKNSPWRDGKGDLVRELAAACAEEGLKFGVYLSPWDRNRADYGTPSYINYFRNQLTELLTNYGPIFEIWFDGANGGTGYYGGARENRQIDRSTYYDWLNTYALVRKLQPEIVIWNDGGDRADLRWVGTEDGEVGETNWSLLDKTGDVPWSMLHHGVENGDAWVPAEVNTSIRPEWFYHPAEDDKVKSAPHLLDTYYKSVGRNATLLLNFPIMPNGEIHPRDEASVREMAAAVKASFATNLAAHAKVEASNVRGGSSDYSAAKAIDSDLESHWATDDEVTQASFTIDFGAPTRFNRFLAQEHIALGQRVQSFTVEALVSDHWREVASGTTIGYKRILRFPSVEASSLRFSITKAKSCPVIANLGVYNAPVFLSAPVVTRNQAGEVSITTTDVGPDFYFTMDGTQPTEKNARYSGPFPTEGKVEIRAISLDPSTGKSSPERREQFDICRRNWRLVGVDDSKSLAVLDGDPATAWHWNNQGPKPGSLIVDLGGLENLVGFSYLPDQNRWSSGVISEYRFDVSMDGAEWRTVSQGEFANIANNPVLQERSFSAEPARFVRLQAINTTSGDPLVGCAEMGVMTQSSQ